MAKASMKEILERQIDRLDRVIEMEVAEVLGGWESEVIAAQEAFQAAAGDAPSAPRKRPPAKGTTQAWAADAQHVDNICRLSLAMLELAKSANAM